MTLYDTMTDLLSDARGKARHIQFIDGEHDESSVTFGELWERALGLTGSLQARGMEPGDELVIFSKSNESFAENNDLTFRFRWDHAAALVNTFHFSK